MQLTGAQALIKSLEQEAVEVIFGLPGGCILPGLRPAAGVDDPPHPRAPRAGRRPHGRGLRPRHRSPRRGHGDVGPGGDEPRHAADGRLHGLDPDGRHHRPGVDGGDRQRRLPGVRHRRHHPLGHQAQRARDDAPRTCRWRSARRSTWPRPGAPGRCSSTCPKDVLQNSMEWYWPTDDEVHRLAARLPAQHQGPPADDQGGRPADPRVRAPGALHRRRHPQGPRRRGGPRARRAARHPRRHDADGPRRVPRRPPAVPRHAGHARQRHGDRRAAAQRPADHARRPLRRPHHRARCRQLRPRGQGHPRRHRPGRAGQGAPARRPDRRRLQVRHGRDHQGGPRPARRRDDAGRHVGVEEPHLGLARAVPADLRAERAGRGAEAAVLPGEAARRRAATGRSSPPASASTRCGRRSTGSSTSRTRG